jgi:serine/threonine protein kinase
MGSFIRVNAMTGDPMVGRVIGGYRIDAAVGRGGMGVVYRAEQLALRRVVALKLITPDFAADEGFRDRFVREGRVAASIEHPHVIPVYESGESDGLLFISMRFVDGMDLRTAIAQAGRLHPQRAATIVAQVGAALDAAHARGLVHRDVKPANVVLGRDGGRDHAYLTDFGLTKHMSSSTGMTRSGQWVGTIDYAAPEQVESTGIDARTDVYALGCVLYHALSGTVPFARDSDVAKIYAKLNDTPPQLSPTCGASPAFDDVIRRALAYSRDARYPSTGDLGRAALAAAEGHPALEPERSVATGAAAPETQPIAPSYPTYSMPQSPQTGVMTRPEPAAYPTPPLPRDPPPGTPRETSGARRGLLILAAVALVAVGAVVATLATGGAGSGKRTSKSTGVARNRPRPQRSARRRGESGGRSAPPPVTTPSVSVNRFSTPRTAGASFRAAYCRAEAATLYCWTPNDGYTIAMGDGPPYRLRGDEAGNKTAAPDSYRLLNFGETRSIGTFDCTSRSSGLSCRNAEGYSWSLPRYRGLPQAFGPDGSSLGQVK